MATLVTLISLAMLAAAIGLQVFTFARKRPVRPIAIALGQSASFLSMIVFSVVMMRPPGPCEWAALLLVGVVGGLAYGGLVKVEHSPAGIVMSYTLPWLIVWGSLLGVTQGLALLTGRIPWVVYSLAVLNMALNLGMNGRVVARYSRMKSAGFAAVVLVVPLLVAGMMVAPGATRHAEAVESVYSSIHGSIASEDEVPQPFASLTDAFELVDDTGSGFVFTYQLNTESDFGFDYVEARFTTAEGASTVVDIFRSAEEAAAAYDVMPKWGGYFALGNAAVVNTSDESFVPALSNAARPIDPDAVFALFDAPPHAPGGAPVGEDPTGGDGGETEGGGVPLDGGPPESESAGPTDESGTRNEPVTPAHLAVGTGLANGLFLLGTLGQFLLTTLGQTPISPGGPPTPPSGSPIGMPTIPEAAPPLPPAPEGKVWYQAPWEEGGPVPMDAAEVAAIEARKSQGFRWSKTDGWVTPEQGAEYESIRARQRAIDRAEADAQAAFFHQRIQAARAARAAAAQEQKNWNRRWGIHLETREAEKQYVEAMGEAASADRMARAWGAAGTVGDLAATGIGIFGGPLGIAVRAGYRVAKGAAAGLGTALADEASWGETNKRVYLGTVKGAVDAGKEMAIDGAVRWAFGMPPMFPKTPVSPPVPPALLVPKAIVKQAVGEAGKIAETKGIAAAVKAVDPAKIVRLYKDGGMARLGQLEQAGAITTAEAQVIRKVLANEVNGAVTAGAKEVAKDFGKQSGVKVKELLLGDSGSSASGRIGSVITDADRTVVAVFQPDDLAAYAAKHGISPAKAAERLNQQLTQAVEEKVGAQLGAKGLTAEDVGFKGYSGFGTKAGPADSYGAGFTRTRQAVQGETLVVRPDGTTYRAGRDAILDAEALGARATGGPLPPSQPTVPLSEFGQLGGQQVKAMASHADPKSVAKAMDRVAYLSGRAGIPVDKTVVAAARAVHEDPQHVAAALAKYGFTPETFRARASAAADRFLTEFQRSR